MALVGTISGSGPVSISGSAIFANEPSARFPSFPGTDTVFFVSGSVGSKNSSTDQGTSVFGGDVASSGSVYVLGPSAFRGSLTGSLTKLEDGDDYLLAGSGISLATGSKGQVTITGNVGDITSVTAGTGLTGGGDVGGVVLNVDNSVVATLTGSQFVGTLAVTGAYPGNPAFAKRALDIYGNLSDDYLVHIDNDQSSNGHVMKLTTDGTGNGSHLLDMETGSDTIFRARGDGRFGFGNSAVGSMGAGTFVVGIDGGHTADLAISKRFQHLGDSDTFIEYPNNDQISVQAGGKSMIEMTEGAITQVLILSGGGQTSFDESQAADVNFYVSGSAGSRGSTTRGTSVFGGDMVVSGTIYNAEGLEVGGGGWSDDGTNIRLKTITDKVGIGNATPNTKLEVKTDSSEFFGGFLLDHNVTAQYVALDIDSESNHAALRTDGKFGAILTQSISNGAGLMVYRALAEVGTYPLVTFTENHATSDQPTLKIINKGGGHSIIAQQASDIVFRVEQSGRVVVGDGGGDQGILIDAGASASGSIGFSKTSGTTGAEVSFDSGENLVLRNFTNNEDIIFYASDANVDTEVMRIDGSAASVAIGVNSNTVSKLKIHVTDGDNVDGIEIVNADAGQKAIDIDSAGAGIEINGKECLRVTVDEDAGFGAIFARNKGASAVSDPLVKIRDQDGDESALKVIQESTDTSAYAIEIGNVGGTKTSLSGSGQVGIGVGTSTYSAILHVKGIERGDGIILEDADSTDTVVKIYESTDDGVVDVYANNSVTGRIHGNGDSYLSGPFGIGTTGPSSPLTVEDSSTVDIAKIRNTANSVAGAVITVENNRGGGAGVAEDYCGALRFQAQDSASGVQQYAKITGMVDSSTSGGEFGRIDFDVTGDAVTTVRPLVLRSDKVHILSGGASSSVDESIGQDVSFYVSGSKLSADGSLGGTSLFGGDLVTSGTMYMSGTLKSVHNQNSYLQFDHPGTGINSLQLVAGGTRILTRDAAGTPDAIIINNDSQPISTLIRTNAKMGFASKHTTNTVYINSDTASEDGVDTCFWVSGSIGSKNTTTRGTSVFGGDVMISGSMTTNGNSAVTNAGVILTSPDGSRFKLTVDNSGNLTTTAL